LIIGIVGLVIWYGCTKLELQLDGSDVFFAAEHKTREEVTRFERTSHRHEHHEPVSSSAS
jgi:hypothetical protein